MDTFMDRLAQRMTAQELIKANTAADTEEMNKLKAQIEQYNLCLEQVMKLLEEEIEKISGTQVSSENINRLVDEAVAKIRSIQQDTHPETQGLGELQEQLSGQMDALKKQVSDTLSSLERQTSEKLGSLEKLTNERLGTLEKLTDERLGTLEKLTEEKFGTLEKLTEEKLGSLEKQIGEQLSALEKQTEEPTDALEQQLSEKFDGLEKHIGGTLDQIDKQLAERFTTLEDNVHKECVKVYRNVQAVVVEESGKQSETVSGSASSVKKIGGKVGAILGISIAALIVSLGGLVLQIVF